MSCPCGVVRAKDEFSKQVSGSNKRHSSLTAGVGGNRAPPVQIMLGCFLVVK